MFVSTYEVRVLHTGLTHSDCRKQYAVKTGTIRRSFKILRFSSQLESFGFSFDWDREINTDLDTIVTQWILAR